jgi:ABC-type antimicrobial peptide transport system permease subunit
MRNVLIGARNALRNPARAALVILVLGLSVGLFVTMMHADAVTSQQARELKAQAGTLILINESGNASGYAGSVSNTDLPADVVSIRVQPNVARVDRFVKRAFVNNRRPDAPSGAVIGVELGATLRLQSMGAYTESPEVVAGRALTADDSGMAVAVVGEVFARTRGLSLGDSFVIPREELQRGRWKYARDISDLRATVVGIYRVGVVYGDNQVFVPLAFMQDVLRTGRDRVSQYVVRVDSAENVTATAEALRLLLGSGVDVISSDVAALQTARLLESTSASSRLGAVIAGIAGALLILFVMVIVTRERIREIGILKAIGASNGDVAAMFIGETAALALVSGGVGFAIYALEGPILAGIFIGNDGAAEASAAALGVAQIVWGLGLVIAFGLIGSLCAVWQAIRMRPSEAMRQR